MSWCEDAPCCGCCGPNGDNEEHWTGERYYQAMADRFAGDYDYEEVYEDE